MNALPSKITLAALSLTAALATLPQTASAHYHITTALGLNNQLQITTYGTTTDANNNPNSPVLFNPSGLLVDDLGTPAITALTSYSPTGAGSAGPTGIFQTSPIYYGAAFTLTTDYYSSSESPAFATSNGSSYDPSKDPLVKAGSFPDIVYNLVALIPLNGSPANSLSYDIPVNTTGEPQEQNAYISSTGLIPGFTNALDYGYGNHIHGIQLFSLTPGTYNLEIIAHDTTNTFTDSAPAFFQITVTPEPASLTLLSLATAPLFLRRRKI